MTTLTESKKWKGSYRDIHFNIALSSVGEPHTPHSQGTYCYYIFLAESKVRDFTPLWLPDEVMQFTSSSTPYISHDYYSIECLREVDFHHGITYYAKHGHTEGFRYVELGCDYNHLWDHEASPKNLGDILRDVENCIDSIYEANLIKE